MDHHYQDEIDRLDDALSLEASRRTAAPHGSEEWHRFNERAGHAAKELARYLATVTQRQTLDRGIGEVQSHRTTARRKAQELAGQWTAATYGFGGFGALLVIIGAYTHFRFGFLTIVTLLLLVMAVIAYWTMSRYQRRAADVADEMGPQLDALLDQRARLTGLDGQSSSAIRPASAPETSSGNGTGPLFPSGR